MKTWMVLLGLLLAPIASTFWGAWAVLNDAPAMVFSAAAVITGFLNVALGFALADSVAGTVCTKCGEAQGAEGAE